MKKIVYFVLLLISINLYSADSLKVIWGVVDRYELEYNEASIVNVKYKAWISNDFTFLINETFPGNSVEIFSDIRGACVIDMKNFTNWEWQEGDILNIIVRDENDGLKGYEGYGSWEIPDNVSGEIYLGFGDLGVPDSGYPISLSASNHSSELYYATIGIADCNGNKFDFTAEPYDNVTFECWVTGRESEIINQDSERSAYLDNGIYSAVRISSYDFQTHWNVGDTMNVSIKYDTPGPGFYTGTKKYKFLYTSAIWGYDIEFGLDSLSGDPVISDTWVEESGIEDVELPGNIFLYQNYPNPFNPETTIFFRLPQEEHVKLTIFNTEGQFVKELVNGKLQAGIRSVNFNASDLNSGIYYYTLESEDKKYTKKMLFVK